MRPFSRYFSRFLEVYHDVIKDGKRYGNLKKQIQKRSKNLLVELKDIKSFYTSDEHPDQLRDYFSLEEDRVYTVWYENCAQAPFNFELLIVSFPEFSQVYIDCDEIGLVMIESDETDLKGIIDHLIENSIVKVEYNRKYVPIDTDDYDYEKDQPYISTRSYQLTYPDLIQQLVLANETPDQIDELRILGNQ